MKKIYAAALLYLYLPLLLFLWGWTAVWVSIPVTIATGCALFFCYGKMTKNEDDKIAISWKEIAVVFVIFLLFRVFCGDGDLFLQDYDWNKHHAILFDLVNYRWPVEYSGDVMLTYYLGQYMVPAFVGKICGHSCGVAVWAMAFWNAAGLTLVYAFISRYVKAEGVLKKAGVIIVMIFFSGATNLGSGIYRVTGHDVYLCSYKWIDIGRIRVHFASNLDALRGAFQHVIVPWLGCCIFLRHKKDYFTYVLIALPMLFSSTFGFVYFAGLLVCYFVWNFIRDKDRIMALKQAFAKEELLLLPLTAVIVIYLSGNVFGDKPDMVGFDLLNMFDYLDFYLIFIVVEFLGYMLFLFRENKKNILFYLILGELLLMPFISLGMFNDLCSRGSIPARFILMVLCLEQFYKYGLKNWRNIAVAIIFMIGAWNSLKEAHEVISISVNCGLGAPENMQIEWNSYEGWAANPNVRADDAYNYYTLNYSDSLFYKISR